jgi:uncharacterized protein YyaL (SSP411 family)
MHTNHLIKETSPYLLQHAHNPVNWYPWGEEALNRAREENKPVLVSIGYAACHWCHVMEKESFEDEATAAIMNEHFINIKIDREERPDLDHIYMDAVQAMTGSGGWPLNVFLTPDAKPFFGGTYFPPERAYNRLSWKEVLLNIHQAFQQKHNDVITQAHNLTEHLLHANTFGSDNNHSDDVNLFQPQQLHLIAENILKQADTEWGGFGKAPKFPQTFCIQFLLRHYHFTKDEKCLQQALLSIDKMIFGGLYDQAGGGFARYSTDEQWMVPHFEKMLYDNALLVSVLSEAYQVTRKEIYLQTIHQTMHFIVREMRNEEKGFYSALDADSEGVEGKFYTWSKAEIENLLQEDADLFCKFFNVEEDGNWEHTNILWIKEPLEIFCRRNELALEEVKEKIERGKNILLAARQKRTRPITDDKILLGWNALMNIACTKAYAATGEEKYLQLAISNIEFLEQQFKTANGWMHTYKNGIAKIPAFLDDYAYLIQAYIQLQQVSGNLNYLHRANALTHYVIEHFGEKETGLFYFTHQHQSDIIVRKKEVYDGATPSGNAMMALNFCQLFIAFDQPEWKKRAGKMLQSLLSTIIRYPTSFGMWAAVLQLWLAETKEIVIAGENAQQYVKPVISLYLPEAMMFASDIELADFPVFQGKFKGRGIGFYLCKNYVCKEPIHILADFLQICNM